MDKAGRGKRARERLPGRPLLFPGKEPPVVAEPFELSAPMLSPENLRAILVNIQVIRSRSEIIEALILPLLPPTADDFFPTTS